MRIGTWIELCEEHEKEYLELTTPAVTGKKIHRCPIDDGNRHQCNQLGARALSACKADAVVCYMHIFKLEVRQHV